LRNDSGVSLALKGENSIGSRQATENLHWRAFDGRAYAEP
jgi:hypothetical protein